MLKNQIIIIGQSQFVDGLQEYIQGVSKIWINFWSLLLRAAIICKNVTCAQYNANFIQKKLFFKTYLLSACLKTFQTFWRRTKEVKKSILSNIWTGSFISTKVYGNLKGCFASFGHKPHFFANETACSKQVTCYICVHKWPGIKQFTSSTAWITLWKKTAVTVTQMVPQEFYFHQFSFFNIFQKMR